MNTYAARDSRPHWQPKAGTPATDKQIAFITKLMGERGVTQEQLLAEFPNRPTKATASGVIDWLRAKPLPTPSTPQVADNYDGIAPKAEQGKRAQAFHYALRQEDGTVKFYRVKAGRKAGFYFVDAQASDDYYPIRNPAHRKAILEAIDADRKAALALYGQELGRCGRCGRTLTSEYRELGIGPVCIDK